jgi:hypothetical protein
MKVRKWLQGMWTNPSCSLVCSVTVDLSKTKPSLQKLPKPWSIWTWQRSRSYSEGTTIMQPQMAKVEDREMGAVKAVFLLKHGSSFIANDDYSLYESTTLDSVTTINIFNDLSRFQIFQ